MKNLATLAAPLCALFTLSACTSEPGRDGAGTAPVQDEFWAALSSHCGKAYSGNLVSDDEVDADFVGAEMVMHVMSCDDARIAVPFHVKLGNEWDRSRTWLISRTGDQGLRLKHDHRHEDGEEDKLTQYGGDTSSQGSARAQSFPVDQFSIDMFNAQGYEASVTNVWTVEVDPAGSEDAKFTYQLSRTVEGGAPEDRLFRVEFDLNTEVEAPPPAWGHGTE